MTRDRKLVTAGVALGLALGLVAGAAIGRLMGPEKVQTSYVDRVVFKDRVVEKIVTAKAKTEVVYRDVTHKPDGTVVDRSIEKSVLSEKASADREKTHEGKSTIEIQKTITARPDWRVSAGVGASIVQPALPVYGPLVMQAEVDRRIVGGLSVGVWGSTVGAAGVAVSLEF